MNTPYIFVNIVACLCFVLMFIAFFAAERSREMNAWILLLFDMVLWSAGSLFMRFELYPSYQFWFYVSLLALFMVPFLIYNYVYQVANENRPTIRWVWFLGTLAILAISATGFFLAPPQKMVDGFGNTLFVYKSDYKIAIPTVFLFVIIFSIIKLFNKILKEKGKRAPGVNELIIGCVLLGLGNIIQILPGNTFPWDTLSGIVFVILISISLYKRYMFNTSMLVSGNLLYIIANSICVLSAALSFHKVRDFCEKNGHKITSPEVAAFIILSIALFIAIYAFRKLLNSIFTDDDQQSTKLKKYSDAISRTLSVEEILAETVKVIQSEISVKQLYICLLEEDKYIPMRSAMPLNPGNFVISADNPCVKYLQQGENYLVLKEFASTPLYKSIREEIISYLSNKTE